jgi:caa(3)-type oxidase subunit IV
VSETTEERHETHEGNALKTGAAVFLVLAFFTVAEYFVAQEIEQNLAPLFVIAAVKAGLILWYFMHVSRSWRGGHS